MLISDGVQTCALPIFRSRPSAVREKGRGTAGGEFPLVEEPQMSLPATINSQVDPAAVTRVTRLFNNTHGDILSELIQNARRAGASAVDLQVIDADGTAFLAIADDGAGIGDPPVILALGRWGGGLQAENFHFARSPRCPFPPRSTARSILPPSPESPASSITRSAIFSPSLSRTHAGRVRARSTSRSSTPMGLRFSPLPTMAPGSRIHRSFSPSVGRVGVTRSRGGRILPAWACSALPVAMSRFAPARARLARAGRSASLQAIGSPARPSPLRPAPTRSEPRSGCRLTRNGSSHSRLLHKAPRVIARFRFGSTARIYSARTG